MSDFPSGQTRTPPHLKWLLNERAALAGEVNKATLRSQALAAKLDALQVSLTNLHLKVQSVSAVKAERQATLAALDTAIGLACQDVRPDAAGVVNAMAGKYGQRGGLIGFVAGTLRDVAPSPLSGRQLISLVAWHFHIALTVPQDRRSLKVSVKSAITYLSKRGLVCPAHSGDGTKPGLWCWKQPDTLADLAARAAGIETAWAIENTVAIGAAPDAKPFLPNAGSPAPADPHTSRCEVAAQ